MDRRFGRSEFALGLVILSMIGMTAPQVVADTEVSGHITENSVWTLANSPYIVVGNVWVDSGVTLQIEPGVTVKFDTLPGGVDTLSLIVDGKLYAEGEEDSLITFTSNETYYIAVTAYDNSGNESWYSNEISVNLTGVEEDTVYYILPITAYPNPFSKRLTIDIRPKTWEGLQSLVFSLRSVSMTSLAASSELWTRGREDKERGRMSRCQQHGTEGI